MENVSLTSSTLDPLLQAAPIKVTNPSVPVAPLSQKSQFEELQKRSFERLAALNRGDHLCAWQEDTSAVAEWTNKVRIKEREFKALTKENMALEETFASLTGQSNPTGAIHEFKQFEVDRSLPVEQQLIVLVKTVDDYAKTNMGLLNLNIKLESTINDILKAQDRMRRVHEEASRPAGGSFARNAQAGFFFDFGRI